MYACRTSVKHWASSYCSKLDRTLEREGFQLLDLPWHTFELRPYDSDHFTKRGFRTFSNALASRLAELDVEGRTIVIADSTIDWLNDGMFDAHKKIRQTFRQHGLICRVASQSGSGFCALEREGRDFGRLLREALEYERYVNVVVIGGWNDERHGFAMERSRAAVSMFAARWRARA